MIFKSFDDAEIYVHEWLDVSRPVGVVQIIHGMAEHAGRYEPYARFLNEHGYLVIADDHRGHGKTDRATLGYRAGDMFADTVQDERLLTAHYRERFLGLKYFVFGFSYGSFLTQSYISGCSEPIDGAVIAGSNYKKDAEVYLGSAVAALGCAFCGAEKPAKLIEKLSFGAYAKKFDDGNWLSTDANNNAEYAADPLCGFTCSFRFYKDFCRGLKRLYTKKYIAGLKKSLPLLLVSGAQDPVGDMGEGVKKLCSFYREKAGMHDVTLKLFEGSRHEFLNESEEREEKWNAPLAFFDRIAKA